MFNRFKNWVLGLFKKQESIYISSLEEQDDVYNDFRNQVDKSELEKEADKQILSNIKIEPKVDHAAIKAHWESPEVKKRNNEAMQKMLDALNQNNKKDQK